MDDANTKAGGSADKSTTDSKSTTKATTTLRQGDNELSGYMVASGEGGYVCRVGDTDYEGDFAGPEGESCSVSVSVK
jgi:hypothetical protein